MSKIHRIILHGHTAQVIKPSNYSDLASYGNPQKFFGGLTEEQNDLYFINCVLTEERGNLNGLWFTQPLLISKHSSARLKPFNFAHDSTDVIGVMYDSAICDEDNRVIDLAKEVEIRDGNAFHNLKGPYYKGEGKIRVNVAAVLYSKIGKGKVSSIIKKIEDGEQLAVSMECWVRDYDFYLLGEDGSIEFAEGSKSSYLHEFVNKEFAGRIVYKVPQIEGFLFGGIGQVENGACPASVILTAEADRNYNEVEGNSTFDCLDKKTVSLLVASLKEEEVEENTNENKIDERVNQMALKDEKKEAASGTEQLTSELVSQSVNTGDMLESFSKLSQNFASSQEENESLKISLSEKDQQIATISSEKEELNKKLSETEGQLETEKKNSASALNSWKYLAKIYREERDLVQANLLPSEEEMLAVFSAEDFNDESFTNFTTTIKDKFEQAQKEKEDLKRICKAEILGLPETATDEEIKQAEDKLKENQAAKEKANLMPEKSGQEEEVKIIAASQETKEEKKVTSSGAVIEISDTQTKKVETITI